MPNFRNKNILLDREGLEITVQQALAKIRRLRKLKAKDTKLFELNGEASTCFYSNQKFIKK